MATPLASYTRLSGDRIVDGMTHGYFWKLDSTKSVDFSLSNGFYEGQNWLNPNGFAAYITQALNTFSLYADIKFNYVGFYTSPIVASNNGSEINFGLSETGKLPFVSNDQLAIGIFPDSAKSVYYGYSGAPGDIYLNLSSSAASLPTYQPGSLGWWVLIHELLHTLGLKHPHDDGGTGRPKLTELGIGGMGIGLATVMSYEPLAGQNKTSWNPAGPMILDVLALQALYGKNLTVNTTNTVYKLEETNFYYTIWDAGGEDTLDASAATSSWSIRLPDVALSKLVDTKVGLAGPKDGLRTATPHTLIWLAGDYENVIGSSYADIIGGNLFHNTINAGAGDDDIYAGPGNDTIDGGAGIDSAVYVGNVSNYTVTKGASSYTVTDKARADGTDTLTNIERLQYGDKTINLTVQSQAAAAPRADVVRLSELYVAFFNRLPDADGLSYWIGQKVGGQSIDQIAETFYNAGVQYSSLTGFSASMSNTAFIDVIYKNVLGRAEGADAGGLAYWNAKLVDGSATRGSLVSTILDSAHTFKGNKDYGYVADLLDNKIAVAQTFAIDWGLNYNTANDSITNGMAIAAAITPTSTAAAISLIGVDPTALHLG